MAALNPSLGQLPVACPMSSVLDDLCKDVFQNGNVDAVVRSFQTSFPVETSQQFFERDFLPLALFATGQRVNTVQVQGQKERSERLTAFYRGAGSSFCCHDIY